MSKYALVAFISVCDDNNMVLLFHFCKLPQEWISFIITDHTLEYLDFIDGFVIKGIFRFEQQKCLWDNK